MDRRHALSVLAGATLGGGLLPANGSVQGASTRERVEWVAQVLQQMERVKPGMTRADLLSVFTTEGGLSTGLNRTFVNRDCPYFKVDVAFRAVGRSGRDQDGRVTLLEDLRDVIESISRPYLAFTVAD